MGWGHWSRARGGGASGLRWGQWSRGGGAGWSRWGQRSRGWLGRGGRGDAAAAAAATAAAAGAGDINPPRGGARGRGAELGLRWRHSGIQGRWVGWVGYVGWQARSIANQKSHHKSHRNPDWTFQKPFISRPTFLPFSGLGFSKSGIFRDIGISPTLKGF